MMYTVTISTKGLEATSIHKLKQEKIWSVTVQQCLKPIMKNHFFHCVN